MLKHATGHQNSLFFEIKADIPFFIPSKRKLFIEERTSLWQKQVDTYAKIKCGLGSTPSSWGTTRIDILVSNLNTIDRKFATLLQFQGLLGIATSVFVATFRTLLLGSPFMVTLLCIFSVLWFLIVFVCMRGVGRIRWGDLWTLEDVAIAEVVYVRTLIQTVIRRTAIFRGAVLLGFLNGLLLFAVVITIWMSFAL